MRNIVRLLIGCSLVAGLCAAAPVVQAAPVSPAPVSPAAVSPAAVSSALAPNMAGSYQPIAAKRVLDTRSGLGGFKGRVFPRQAVSFNVSSARPNGNPVSAVVLDVTAPMYAPGGSLSVYPSGTGWDGRVTMTLMSGMTNQQQLTVSLGADGGVTVRRNAGYAMHVLVDVLGFYVAGTATGTGKFAPANSRVLDTRTGLGTAQGSLGAGHKVTLAMAGRGGVPAGGATAVIVNVAVLSALRTGQLAITNGDGSQATTPLRFAGFRDWSPTMQTERIVKLGSDGTLTFTNTSAASVHLVVDVFGYFLRDGETGYSEGSYVALSPQPTNSGQRLVLKGYLPGTLVMAGLPAQQHSAVNIVVATYPAMGHSPLGLYGAGSPWSGSSAVSPSPLVQPTELTVRTQGVNAVTVRSVINWESWVHAYVTGYYYKPPVAS